MPTLLLLLVMLCLASTAHAEPLYVQRVEAARPTAEAVAKAREQVREHKDIQVRENLKVPPFHKRVDDPVRQGEAFCQGCHLPLPHTEQLRTRAFLNMHSRFIACETCHFRPENAALDYRWLDYASRQPAPAQNRFRTGLGIDNAEPIPGGVKITPFRDGVPVIAFPGSDFAERILREWKDGDEAGRAGLKARLHAPLEKEGPACARCHGEDRPLLDLAALGAAPDQATAIRRHVIPQFFDRYKDDNERLKIIDILR
jgi:RNase P subunit RPR2